jgi:transcriptional regulator with XRE-family HTH domain
MGATTVGLVAVAPMHILRCMHNLALKGEVTAHPMRETWPSYVRRITEGLDRKAIAAAAEINVSGVSRWLTGVSRPSPEKAINFARSLNHSPVEALICAGYLDETDTDGQIIKSPLAELSDDALIDELRTGSAAGRRCQLATSSDPSPPSPMTRSPGGLPSSFRPYAAARV